MTWWFKARRGHLLLPLALLVFGAGLYAVQGTTVLLPSLVGSPGSRSRCSSPSRCSPS